MAIAATEPPPMSALAISSPQRLPTLPEIPTVADSGVGIPPDEQARIFERMFRASNVQEGFAGTGLGLSIVKSIVDRHGGRIWVGSPEGEGTAFTVMLPRMSDR